MIGSSASQRSGVLDQPLDMVKGVGPKVLSKLKRLGLETIEDALYHLPLRYEDRRQLKTIRQLVNDQQQIFFATVLASGETQTARQRRNIYEVVVGDESGTISLKWFRFRKSWLQKRFPIGQKAVFIGEVKHFGAVREIHHPEAELISETVDLQKLKQSDPLNFGRILPVYPSTEGLSQKQMRKIWFDLVERYAGEIITRVPAAIASEARIASLSDSLRQLHWPADNTDLYLLEKGQDLARQSLVFDELFFLEAGLAMRRAGVQIERGIAFGFEHKYTIPLNKMLPFKLTDAQRRVLGEIKEDMMSPKPMHRLLQGDVGSGKTLVALMAALIAIENNAQVAVVAPTEILAEQHYQTFSHWLIKLGLKAALLQGSMTARQKREALEQVAAGEIDLLVGTHAVLQQGVEFKYLGLGIVDEQHRFGVRQRSILKQKGCNPDILVMTATPIPRTLSMTLYGDLAISVIDQLPPGRQPITTRIIAHENRNDLYRLIDQEVSAGRQAYIVYPLVEESEKLDLTAATQAADELSGKIFPHFSLGLLHGRMKSHEKDEVMDRFRRNEVQILVSTTVIEVGVDVPNATVMVIEHADRFGLSQLHQLRGRVGRGGEKSYCVLVPSQQLSHDARQRLEVMVSTEDGFRLAEADLNIRGPGDFLGTRQSGLPDLRVANLLTDQQILVVAQRYAFSYVEQTRQLTTAEAKAVRLELMRRWGGRLELAAVG